MEKENEEFNDFEILDEKDKEFLNDNENINIDEDENFDEVLTLTEYADISSSNNSMIIAAEYNNINIVEVSKKNENLAKSFVTKITKFITDFKDVELTNEHQSYLKIVGSLQLNDLKDLLNLVDINKQMMNNIVARVNSVQAEDYAMIATYNSLVNQHLKLLRELSITYKNIPSVIKKMRTEILCNQQLGDIDNKNDEAVITENYGTTQFNNQKDMLKKLRELNENQK